MKVRISDIPPDGLTINDTLDLQALTNRMLEGGRETGIVFTSAPSVALTITRTIGGAEARGKLSAKYTQSCGRCLEPVEKNLDLDTSLIISPKPDVTTEEGEDSSSAGIVYYEGDSVELEDVLQENLILSLSLYWSPPVNSRGACDLCGLRITTAHDGESPKEERVKFGDLLKKAIDREQ